ncbi:MAG: hypothetical protein ACR2L2_18090 [Acidobacteriota bacterium]
MYEGIIIFPQLLDMKTGRPLSEIPQILSISLFEKTPISRALRKIRS